MKKKEAKIEKDKTLSERGLADLDTLMQHAKELSHLAKSTSSRIETKQGSNLDEAAQLRGIMMSLGTEFLLSMYKSRLQSKNRQIDYFQSVWTPLAKFRIYKLAT